MSVKLTPEQQKAYDKLLKSGDLKFAEKFLEDITRRSITDPKKAELEVEKEKLEEAQAQAEQDDPRTGTSKNLDQIASQNNFVSRADIADDKINVLIRSSHHNDVLVDGQVITGYGLIYITSPSQVTFATVTNIEFTDPNIVENYLSSEIFSSGSSLGSNFAQLKYVLKGFPNSETTVKVTWSNGWEKIFDVFIPWKRAVDYNEEAYIEYGQATSACTGSTQDDDYTSVSQVMSPGIEVLNTARNKALHTFTKVVEDPANLWQNYLPWWYNLRSPHPSYVGDAYHEYNFLYANSNDFYFVGSYPHIYDSFTQDNNQTYATTLDTAWETDDSNVTWGITGYTTQEQQVKHIQNFSDASRFTDDTSYLLNYTTGGLLTEGWASSYFIVDEEGEQSEEVASFLPSLYAGWWGGPSARKFLANELKTLGITYDGWIANLDSENPEGLFYDLTGVNFPDSINNVGGDEIGIIGIPTATQKSPAIGWIQYSKNLEPCAGDIPTFYVCSDTTSSYYYNTTNLDCDGNTIPATYLSGALAANFVATDCCTFDCEDENYNADFSDVTSASYNSSDGSFKFTIFDNDGDGVADSGFPTTTGGSQFTVALTALDGSTITQTLPASQGSSTGISCITNTTAATAHQVTLAGGAQSDLVSPGMQVTGTGIPDGTFVGQILTGTIGADGASGVSKFTLVSVTGEQVSATAAATNTLQFSMGYSIEFGSLAADTYTVSITNSESCTYLRSIRINQLRAPQGCTDSGALNYDSTAVNDDQSCIFCNAATGNIENASGILVETGIGNFTNISQTVSTDPLGSNNDGSIQFQLGLYPLVTASLTATMSYTITLFSHPTEADSQAYTNATQVAQQTGQSSPTYNFTGLGYGFYSVKIEIEDSSTGADAGLEKCFSRAAGKIPANVCSDSQSNSFNDYLVIPTELWAHEINLCNYDCTTTADISITYDQDIPCNPVSIAVSVDYEGVAVGYTNNTTSTLTIIWYQDGVQMGAPFVQAGIFGDGNLINILSSPSIGWNGVTPGVHTYSVEVGFTNSETNQSCTTVAQLLATIPLCGCTDGDPNTNGGIALNFNALATIDDGSCIYESYNCNPLTFQCTDPLDGTGTFQDYNTCMQNACTPEIIDCFDPLASNYNPNTTIPDNSLCEYSACLDPNSIQINGQYGVYYDCDGNYLPSATIAQNSCCIYCTDNEPVTFSPTTTNATISSDCITNSDGSFSIYAYTSSFLNCPSWSIEIFNASGPISLTNNTGISNNAIFNTGNILPAGAYTYVVTDDCYGCSISDTFFITADSSSCGCTDPNADNYDSNATSDDGSCVYCGCTDPLANNYDPNAVCEDGSCTYTIPVNPCQLDATQKKRILENIENCLANKGLSYLNKLKTGLADDCSIMNTWKLILVDYVLKSHGGELDCLYNCQDGLTPNEIQNNQTCAELLSEGGPTTGLNDAGYPGSTYTTGIGTVITDPNLYFVQNTIVWEGDVIQMPSGNIYVMSSGVSCTQGCYNPESAQGQQSGHWQLCQNNTTFTFTDADTTTAASVAYLDKFINFANKFCADCATDFIAQ